MIEVIRKDYPPRRKKDGSKVLPHFECIFRYNKMQIAFYDSTTKVLYLRTDIIGNSKESAYKRALSCGCADAYKNVFEKMRIYGDSPRIQEYI